LIEPASIFLNLRAIFFSFNFDFNDNITKSWRFEKQIDDAACSREEVARARA
jgi:hypothetical protein